MIKLLILTNTVIASTPMNFQEYSGHDNFWESKPQIVICKSQTIFTKEDVEKAISAWNESYHSIVYKEKCTYTEESGKIKIIDGKNLNYDQWGYTSYIYNDVKLGKKQVKKFKSALVQINKNINNIDILIHEIGHAFGYSHYDGTYDIMNSYADYSSNYTYNFPF